MRLIAFEFEPLPLTAALLTFLLPNVIKAASLTGSFTPLEGPTNIDLTTEGQLDWAHWGLLTPETGSHKYGVKPQISSSFTAGRYDGPYRLNDSPIRFSWSDGTPFQSVTNTATGLYILGVGNGFQIQCPADTTPRHLKIYVGTFTAKGALTASLSGASAYGDSSLDNPTGTTNGVYSLDFTADSSGEMLTVTFTLATDYQNGNVSLQAASLSGADAPPFVRITSPAEGDSLIAPATFRVTATAFDPDGLVTNLMILDRTNVLGESNTSIASNVFSLTLTNQATNAYQFNAVATDDQGLSITSPPVKAFVIAGGGTLSGSFGTPDTNVNLTTEGTLDWAHWGLNSSNDFDHKAIASPVIPNFSILPGTTEMPNRYSDNLTAFTWTDGTPTPQATNTTTGVFIYGLNNGFEIAVPATNIVRRLKLYVGLYGAQGRLDASLSDWSAAPFSDDTLYSAYGNAYRVYTLNFSSPNPGAMLEVRWTDVAAFDPTYGNVTWQAATLASSSIAAAPLLRIVDTGAPGGFAFSFDAAVGAQYEIQNSESLLPSSWQVWTNVSGSNAPVTIRVSTSGSRNEFFRVQAK